MRWQTLLMSHFREIWKPFHATRKLNPECMRILRKFGTAKSAPPWDVMFFGTDEFSVRSLMALRKEQQMRGLIGRLDVVSVTLKKIVPAVRQYCLKEGIHVQDWPVVVPHGMYDIAIVVSFGHLIPSSVIEAFPLGILNIHGSLLPRWRGAAPVIHALLNNDQETGITVMKIEPHRFDVGKVVSKVAVPIAWDTKSDTLANHLAEVGAQELLCVLRNLLTKLQTALPQPEDGITKAPKVNEATAKIHWNQYTCSNIQARYRALDDRFPLWTSWHGTRVRLRGMVMTKEWSCRYLDETNKAVEIKSHEESEEREYEQIEKMKTKDSGHLLHKFPKNKCQIVKSMEKSIDLNEMVHERNESHNIQIVRSPFPGTIMLNKKQRVLSVRCLDGWVNFSKIEIKGRKPMTAQDFYNGFVSKVAKDLQKFEV